MIDVSRIGPGLPATPFGLRVGWAHGALQSISDTQRNGTPYDAFRARLINHQLLVRAQED